MSSVIQVNETNDSHLITCLVSISENAAVRTGKPRFGTFEVRVDPATMSPEEREAFLATNKREWNAKARRYWNYQDAGSGNVKVYLHDLTTGVDSPDVPDCSDESIHQLLQWHVQAAAREAAYQVKKAAENKAEHDKLVQEWLDKTDMEFCYEQQIGYQRPYCTLVLGNKDVFQDPRLADRIKAVEATIAMLNEKRRLNYEDGEVRKAEAEKLAAEKKTQFDDERKAQIDEWVKLHGSESQQKRHAYGLLPIKEVEDALRERAFTPLSHLDRYEKILARDVCCCEYATCTVNFDVDDATEATADEFAMFEQIRHLMSCDTVQLRTHTAYANDCDVNMERKSIRVEIEVGTFTFSREYAVN